jgi:hypothetical protein
MAWRNKFSTLIGDVATTGNSGSGRREFSAHNAEQAFAIWNALLALDISWQLAESLLQKADKMSMVAELRPQPPPAPA